MRRLPRWMALVPVAVVAALLSLPPQGAVGQTGKAPGKAKGKVKGPTPAVAKQLDAKAEKMSEAFKREAADMAKEYEDAGMFEKAKETYEMLLKVDPSLTGAEKKVKELHDQLLSSNEFDLDLDVGRSWSNPVAMVFKDHAFRVQCDASYKFTLTGEVDADGFKGDDPSSDIVGGIPLGALMGVILGEDGKPGKPFQLGSKKETTPQNNGRLLLRVNAPGGHRSSGKLKVKISGFAKQI